jgi:hypothetical protein
MSKVIRVALAATLLARACVAYSAVVTWTLDVPFNDGATASGFFVVNTATNTIGDFNIATTAGFISGFDYTPSNSSAFFVHDIQDNPPGSDFSQVNFGTKVLPGREINFLFAPPLSATGGTSSTVEFTFSNFSSNETLLDSSGAPGNHRFIPFFAEIRGVLAVPEPSLLVIGIITGLLVLLRNKQPQVLFGLSRIAISPFRQMLLSSRCVGATVDAGN